MVCCERVGEKLIGLEEVVEIGTGKVGADVAGAVFVEWFLVGLERAVCYSVAPFGALCGFGTENVTDTGQARGEDAIKQVGATLDAC